MSEPPENSLKDRLTYRRRTIMGALAAGAGLGSYSTGASAQDDETSDDDWLPSEASGAHAAALSGFQAGAETDAGGAAIVRPVAENTLLVDLVLEDIECVTQAHIHEGRRGEDGPVVAPLLEYTAEVDGSGTGNPLTTDPDTPLIEGARVEEPDLVQAILENPEAYYVNVHTVKHPAGEIRGQIRGFEPGQQTEIEPEAASFTVSNLDPVDVTVTQGDVIDVSATIRNSGDVDESQTVQFRLDGNVLAEQRVSLDCRQSRRITFENIDTSGLDPGSYQHGVYSDDDSTTGTLTVEEPEPASFHVSNLDPVDVSVTRGEEITVSATIENVGDLPGTQGIEFRVDDDPIADQQLQLDAGQSATVTFSDLDTSSLEAAEYEHGIYSEDDEETGTLTVSEAEDLGFGISDLSPQDVTVTQGDVIEVNAVVENQDDETATETIQFRVDGDALDEQELELGGGESATVTFSDIDTSPLEPGEYEHGVFGESDSETATLTVSTTDENGDDEEDDENGEDEVNGDDGENGEGVEGEDGEDDVNGDDGENGEGVEGEDGEDTEDGLDGEDGPGGNGGDDSEDGSDEDG